jgi:ribosome maturation factor RimP
MDFGQLLETTVSGLGYELVEWERSGKGRLLRLYVDKTGGINVDDCAGISHHLSRVFEVEGIAYDRLEVSSPGLDRVLRTARDFERFAGEKVRVKLRVAQNGQRHYTGTLRTAAEGKLGLDIDGIMHEFELDGVEKTRLVPNI